MFSPVCRLDIELSFTKKRSKHEIQLEDEVFFGPIKFI